MVEQNSCEWCDGQGITNDDGELNPCVFCEDSNISYANVQAFQAWLDACPVVYNTFNDKTEYGYVEIIFDLEERTNHEP